MKNETMFIDAENDVCRRFLLYRAVEPFVYLLHDIVDKMHEHIIYLYAQVHCICIYIKIAGENRL